MAKEVDTELNDLKKAVENLSTKIDAILADTCAIQPKWVFKFIARAMSIILLFLASRIYWAVCKNVPIASQEAWLLCVIFIVFCTFAVMFTRTLVRRND